MLNAELISNKCTCGTIDPRPFSHYFRYNHGDYYRQYPAEGQSKSLENGNCIVALLRRCEKIREPSFAEYYIPHLQSEKKSVVIYCYGFFDSRYIIRSSSSSSSSSTHYRLIRMCGLLGSNGSLLHVYYVVWNNNFIMEINFHFAKKISGIIIDHLMLLL